MTQSQGTRRGIRWPRVLSGALGGFGPGGHPFRGARFPHNLANQRDELRTLRATPTSGLIAPQRDARLGDVQCQVEISDDPPMRPQVHILE